MKKESGFRKEMLLSVEREVRIDGGRTKTLEEKKRIPPTPNHSVSGKCFIYAGGAFGN